MTALSGCSPAVSDARIVCFNSHTASTYDYKSYHIYAENSTLWMENTDTGEITELIRDPLIETGQGGGGKALFGQGSDVYYILTQTETNAGKLSSQTGTGTVSCFSVIQVNLDTLEEIVVYEKQQINTVFGINLNDGILEEAAYQTCLFFLDDSKLYILYAGVRCIDLRTGKITMLDIPTSSNIAFDGCYIYYVDDRCALCRYNPNDRELTRWSNAAVYDFCLAEDTLYYIDMRQGNQLYAMSVNGTGQKLVLNEELIAVEYGTDGLTITHSNGNVRYVNWEQIS